MPMTLPFVFSLLLSVAMLLVIISDAARYIIPNWLNIGLLLLYGVAALVLPLSPLSALGVAGLILVVGVGLFALGLMGGGDVKLLVVLSLWTGWGMPTLQFLFLTAMVGGLLVIIVLLLRALVAPVWLTVRPIKNLPRLLTKGQPVPYGIAIAGAFLWLLAMDGVPGL